MCNRQTTLLAIISLGFLAQACHEPRGPDVLITVPQGFRGLAQIIEQPKGGVEIDLNAPLYEIPVGGTLRVKSLLPMRRWHVQHFWYKGGFDVPQGTLPPFPQDTLTRVYSLGSTHDTIRFFVGTSEELDDFVRDPPWAKPYTPGSMPNQVGAASQGQPIRSQTNTTSSGAGPRR